MGPVAVLILAMGILITLNGLFACMEIAVVSVPRARLRRYEKEKRPGAVKAINLQKDIDRFFATVQVGVTFIGTLTSVIGGASATELLTPLLDKFGIAVSSPTGRVLSLLSVTVLISYFILVIGELVPKSIARRYPGRVSLAFAGPFRLFSKIAGPVVWFLTLSTRLVLGLIGIRPSDTAAGLTAEDFRMMASELVETRQIPTEVYEMLIRVTRLTQIRVEDIMIPRHRIVSVYVDSKNDPRLREKILKTYRDHPFSYLPVIERKRDNILGVVKVKDLLLNPDAKTAASLCRPALFAARGRSLDKILAVMQKNDVQLSVVVDEHGTVDGIVTLEDVLEELIGEIGPDEQLPMDFSPVPDNSKVFSVDGLITLHELKENHQIALPQSLYYSTLAGFVLDRMGKVPVTGEFADYDQWRFEVSEMERNRIKEVTIVPIKTFLSDKKET